MHLNMTACSCLSSEILCDMLLRGRRLSFEHTYLHEVFFLIILTLIGVSFSDLKIYMTTMLCPNSTNSLLVAY